MTDITYPLQAITHFTYNDKGRLETRTDRNGTTLTYAFTPTGRLASVTYPDLSQTAYSRDSLDRLTGMTDSIGTSVIVPDAAGKITSYTDANGFTLDYQYDAAGNLWKLTYPDGTVVTYGYDNDGRLETFTQFNGIAAAYGYDQANRLVSMGSAVANYQFTLDADGNRVHSNEAQPLTPSLPYGRSAGYVYNQEKNRLLSAGPLAFTYDDEGRLVSSGGVCRVFDWNGRLVQIGNDAEFSYDGLGNRIVAVRAGVVTRYVYDPWGNLMAEADANGITRKYIYGKGLIAVATASARYCYHFNGIGSATALTDMSKNIVNAYAYAYDPFGRILLEQEAIQQPFKYVGQYGVMAEPGGLYYMRARYYDPSVGRFISEDPLGFGGGDVNLFAYVLNNPVNLVDPDGLDPIRPPQVIVEQNGVTIEHYGSVADHGPAHAHVKGGGANSKIGPKGYELDGCPEMTSKQRKVVRANADAIRKELNKLGKALQQFQNLGNSIVILMLMFENQIQMIKNQQNGMPLDHYPGRIY